MIGRLSPRDDGERKAAEDAGYDVDRVLTHDDLVKGDDAFFSATGVTDGDVLQGVRYQGARGASTESLVMRTRSGTVRRIYPAQPRESCGADGYRRADARERGPRTTWERRPQGGGSRYSAFRHDATPARLAFSLDRAGPSSARARRRRRADGPIGPALSMTGNGRLLQPAGRQTTVGNFSFWAAPTCKAFYWVVDSTRTICDVKVVAVASGVVTQTLPLPGAYGGVAFAPDGLHAYVSGTKLGNRP